MNVLKVHISTWSIWKTMLSKKPSNKIICVVWYHLDQLYKRAKNTVEYLCAYTWNKSTQIPMKIVNTNFRILITSRKRRENIRGRASFIFVMTFTKKKDLKQIWQNVFYGKTVFWLHRHSLVYSLNSSVCSKYFTTLKAYYQFPLTAQSRNSSFNVSGNIHITFYLITSWSGELTTIEDYLFRIPRILTWQGCVLFLEFFSLRSKRAKRLGGKKGGGGDSLHRTHLQNCN